MMGKCPRCENFVTVANANPITIFVGSSRFNGVTYNCPHCATVLGCEIDPLALRTEIVAQTAAAVAKDLHPLIQGVRYEVVARLQR